jgi:hypothetical protein
LALAEGFVFAGGKDIHGASARASPPERRGRAVGVSLRRASSR